MEFSHVGKELAEASGDLPLGVVDETSHDYPVQEVQVFLNRN